MKLNIISNIRDRQRLKSFFSKVTRLGDSYEISPGTTVSFDYGANKDNIVLHNHVSLLGCHLISVNNGRIELGDYVKIGSGSKILSVDSIKIEDYTAIATDVTIVDNNNHPINPDFRLFMRMTEHHSDARSWTHSDHKPILIGKNCWIGSDVRIQKGVTIGDNSVIAACSVVTKDVPANCIVAGNPAKVVKTDIDKLPAPESCIEYNLYQKNQKRL